MGPAPAAHGPGARIWLVIGDKAGDNAQVEVIAESLGLPYEVRRVRPLPRFERGRPRFRASLAHLDPRRSDRLEPPWPDLVLTIGHRSSMAALWIQDRSRGRTRIVLIGRPKRWVERFALIILPAQFRMPAHPNVLRLGLPLMRGNEQAIAAAARDWASRLAALPRPITALLIGGQTKPYRLDPATVHALLRQARAATDGGTLYITTSRRTPRPVVNYLRAHLPEGARLYLWSQDGRDNPYLALLGLAERFIVTGDSVSMMVEVARLGRPLAIFALPYRRALLARPLEWLAARLHASDPRGPAGRGFVWLGEALYRLGLIRYSRDLTAIHRRLYRQGCARPLATGFSGGGVRPPDELPTAVARIRRLLER